FVFYRYPVYRDLHTFPTRRSSDLPPAQRSGDYPVVAEGLTKKYGDHVVFKDANMSISRGEKVSFVGRNGEGKSTMIKAIMGEIRSEEHTSELQSRENLVCRLLLEK